MSDIPSELKYASSHEWARMEDDGSIVVGITDHAQALLGDVVYVELPEVDTEIGAGDEIAVVESVKAASDIYAPISGTIVEVNESLEDAPETVNTDCYGDGWMFRIQPSNETDYQDLLDADGYAESIADE